jgi:hypothetical protein
MIQYHFKEDKMNLYEIDKDIDILLDKISMIAEESGGVIPPELSKELNDLAKQKDQKLLNCGRYYKNLEVEEEAIYAEIKRLEKRRYSIQKKMSWLENYIKDSMSKDDKLKDAVITMSFRKSESVTIKNIDEIPNQYIRIDTEKKPLKDEIKDAIKHGINVDGAELSTNYNLQIK